jgi:hypothetical protein
MDLTQSKLTKVEWGNAEIPVSDGEKTILKLIKDGYQNVNIRSNVNQSLFQTMKVDFTPENEIYLYKKYFEKDIQALCKKYKKNLKIPLEFPTINTTSKQPKKADIIRIEYMDKNIEVKKPEIFEYILFEFCTTIIKSIAGKTTKYAFALYTLIQLKKCSIPNTNTFVKNFVEFIIQYTNQQITISDVILQSHEFIEKNPYLLKYEDMTLFNHQKKLFSIIKQNPEVPKLILYIAPTGTGKTLSPIGISEQYRVIFICVARHIGLALAKSAISMGKKTAFAFGCETASDIRLHYFSASSYSVNKRSGSIAKVDNSVGDRIEIMICDVKSYLTAMHYMLAFNDEQNIVTYWDEPTITMDYPEHELHRQIHDNWKQNKISKVVLSCATLPKETEILASIADFREKFDLAEVHTIESHDCRKSISLLNKDSKCMLPHTITEFVDYQKLMECISHCEENKTMLRYFDLSEIVRYIKYINQISQKKDSDILNIEYSVNVYFTNISEITMNSIKEYYLMTFRHINPDKWHHIHDYLLKTQACKFTNSNNTLSNTLTRTHSVQITPSTDKSVITKSYSMNESSHTVVPGVSSSGILLTTNDAHTLTDGPTIFLAEDVEKIGKFYIQSSKIPEVIFNRITERIERNNELQKCLEVLQRTLEDKMGGKEDEKDNKDRKSDRVEKFNPEIRRLVEQIDGLRAQLFSVNLDAMYIPNTNQHQQFWTNEYHKNAFIPDIHDSVVKEIMELDVDNSMKILLLMGIGMFTNQPNVAYMEIMKRLAYEQKLYLIIASSDYIYGTNYSFCHGFIGKDLTNMTQQKIIQAMGRIGRNKIQQDYTVRFRDDSLIMKLFLPSDNNVEAYNMSRLFCS